MGQATHTCNTVEPTYILQMHRLLFFSFIVTADVARFCTYKCILTYIIFKSKKAKHAFKKRV